MRKIKNIVKGILFLPLFLLISGCSISSSSIEESYTQTNIPNWYINSASNNFINIYGTGEGKTIDEAKNNALNNMSSKLLVNIDSTLERKKTSSSDGFYSNEVKENLKVEVEKIQYTNVKIEKNVLINDKYYLLAKVSRTKLFEENKRRFELLDNTLKNKYKYLSKNSKFNQIIKLERIRQDILLNKKRAFVLYAINNDFNYETYFKKYNSYLNKIITLKDELKIKVNSNNSYFSDEFIDLLNNNNFKVSNKSKADVKIRIQNKIRYSMARGWYIAKVTTVLSIHENNQLFSNKVIKSIGRSTSSKENALEDSSIDFIEQLNILEFDNILFNIK